jgi:hypothetical protein
LLRAWRNTRQNGSALDDLGNAIKAIELHNETFNKTRKAVTRLLEREGLKADTAKELTDRWLYRGDFLLAPLEGEFDFVVGNPPKSAKS